MSDPEIRSGVAALVLAAGKGVRLGGPKALLMIDGVPLALAHVVARLHECERVVVVLRREVAEQLPPHTERAPREVVFVYSDEPDEHGPAGSLRAAITAKALEGMAKIVVTPVDVLPAPSRAIHKLLAPLDAGFRAVRFNHGHPIACVADVLGSRYGIDREGAPPPLREVIEALGDQVCKLPIGEGDERIVGDLDTIDDVLRATGAPPKFWSDA